MGESDDIFDDVSEEDKSSWPSGRLCGDVIARCGFDSLSGYDILPHLMYCVIDG